LAQSFFNVTHFAVFTRDEQIAMEHDIEGYPKAVFMHLGNRQLWTQQYLSVEFKEKVSVEF
jgi:hypothetical protein